MGLTLKVRVLKAKIKVMYSVTQKRLEQLGGTRWIIILKVGKNQNFLWYNLIVYSVNKSSSPLSIVVVVVIIF